MIRETGLCIWRSGPRPSLEFKTDGSMLKGRMALWWSGKPHDTPGLADHPRDYSAIAEAGETAREAVLRNDPVLLGKGIDTSYRCQLTEGMPSLPEAPGCLGRKYCGGGFGGYALYLFDSVTARDGFVTNSSANRPIEPYCEWD